MPPKATVEEIFDDDTDLPLPPIPLPKQPLYVPEFSTSRQVSQSTPSIPQVQAKSKAPISASEQAGRKENVVTDITPYKKWTSIYPIYMDAKRPYGTGQRRIARSSSVWWPLSRDLAQAAQAIGIQCLHEPNKTHPRDWENPGRVKVLWKKDGEVVYKRAKTRKQLIEMLSLAIQAAKPDLKPSPEAADEPKMRSAGGPSNAGSSSQQKSRAKSKSSQSQGSPGTGSKSGKKTRRARKRPLCPKPPKPYPPLSMRLSSFSPAIEMGIVKETFKHGMDKGQLPGSEMFLGGGGEGGASGSGGAGGAGGTPGGMGGGMGPKGGSKGKRKVVRVRG